MFIDAITYPLRMNGFIIIIGGALFLAFPLPIPLVGFITFWIMLFLFPPYCLSILRSTANGKDILPEWPDPSFILDEVVFPWFKLVFIIGPVFFGVLVTPPDLKIIVIALAGFFIPMIIMILAVSESFFSAINPVIVLYFFTVIWKEYLLILLPIYMIIYLGLILFAFTSYLHLVISAGVGIYFVMVAMRMLGLIYRSNAHKLKREE